MKRLWAASLIGILFLCFPLASKEAELLGDLTREDILSALPDWQAVAAEYQPDPAAIARLKTLSVPLEIKVYLGTWCSDSKAHVSELFKVLDLAANPLLIASYIGIPRDRSRREEYYRGESIDRLPTFIVLLGGTEKGRIVEIPTLSLERDLVAILDR
ncbi:MAG: hypothetical protein A2Y56_07220 [Candidatus Aminicenantes bacterium RBG_13_63_10]|nr:MAG: hypothetical protein A2Y56_07220 [Candidatus Aminicenantes bacterium RBG_13_63_10]